MADQKFSDLTPLAGANVAADDVVAVLDVSDTTMAGTGTNVGVEVSELAAALATHGNLATLADVAAVVDAAPGALDTLNELAAALGDDANYAATITTALAGKQPLDSDLTAFAALTPSDDDFAQRKAGAWTNRTVVQVKADLGVKPPTQQVLTVGSGTYNTPSGCTTIIVEVVAGGGGGGGADGGSSQGGAGAGGGAGGYARKLIASPAGTYAYTVGAKGTGGAAGANNGNAGADSTFGAGGGLITAKGGNLGLNTGASGTTLAVAAGGAASAASTGGDVNAGGGAGGQAIRYSGTVVNGGNGADSVLGGGGRGSIANDGGAGTSPGAGGGGGGSTTTTDRAGGDGADGIIIVTEFYG